MNIKSPVDLETSIAQGRDLIAESVDALGETLEKFDVKARAETGAADLLDAATTKDGRPKPAAFAVGALVLVVVALLLRRQHR